MADPPPPATSFSANTLTVIQRLDDKRKREKAWRDRKSPEEKAQRRAAVRANWVAKKALYNQHRRERLQKDREQLAKENIVVVRGRPPVARIAALSQRYTQPYTSRQTETADKVRSVKSKVVAEKVTIPEDIRAKWGVEQTTINITKDPFTWPATNMYRWFGDANDADLGFSVLADVTKMSYIRSFVKLLREVGFKDIPTTKDPVDLGKYLIGWEKDKPQFELWEIIRKCVDLHPDVKAQTECSKSMTAVMNATVLRLLEDTSLDVTSPVFTRAFTYPQVTIFWNKLGKRKTSADREAGIVSSRILNNMVDWNQWKTAAEAYLKETLANDKATVTDMREALVVALYSLIPPIRLDWRRVEIGSQRPVRNEQTNRYADHNVFLLDAKGVPSVAYFHQFKNSHAFDAPVEISITSPPLLRATVERYWSLVPQGTTYLLPKGFRGVAKTQEMPDAAMGDVLRRMALKLVQKKFTNIPMRRSFITNYHKEHPVATVAEIKELMTSVHQTTIGTHLTYITGEVRPEDKEETIDKEELDKVFDELEDVVTVEDPQVAKAHEEALGSSNSVAKTPGVEDPFLVRDPEAPVTEPTFEEPPTTHARKSAPAKRGRQAKGKPAAVPEPAIEEAPAPAPMKRGRPAKAPPAVPSQPIVTEEAEKPVAPSTATLKKRGRHAAAPARTPAPSKGLSSVKVIPMKQSARIASKKKKED